MFTQIFQFSIRYFRPPSLELPSTPISTTNTLLLPTNKSNLNLFPAKTIQTTLHQTNNVLTFQTSTHKANTTVRNHLCSATTATILLTSSQSLATTKINTKSFQILMTSHWTTTANLSSINMIVRRMRRRRILMII